MFFNEFIGQEYTLYLSNPKTLYHYLNIISIVKVWAKQLTLVCFYSA